MKKLKLSGFDLGIIIAAVVVALLGGGAWWYLSGELQDAQDEAQAADQDFNKYSASKSAGGSIVVSPSNLKTLQANIDLLKAQLDPLIRAKLQPKENKFGGIGKEDPVAWKHDLDDSVQRLATAAKLHSVTVPPNFYFGFTRYLSQSPSDEQTAVLTKQMVGIEELAKILINAPVKGIDAIRRTYEEDPHIGSGSGPTSTVEPDRLAGYSFKAAGNAYTGYPLEVDFETTSENLRTVLDNLIQSPYLFVVRTLSIENSDPNSPMLNSLDQMAGPPPASVTDSSPGEVAATTSTKGPQYLFGNSTLKVKARIDLIEWTASVSDGTSGPAQNGQNKPPLSPGGN
jgi:predicted metal-binding protein